MSSKLGIKKLNKLRKHYQMQFVCAYAKGNSGHSVRLYLTDGSCFIHSRDGLELGLACSPVTDIPDGLAHV